MIEPRYIRNMAQDEAEIVAFSALLAREGVTSYLEIGSKFGGSLWRAANALPVGSVIVSVDMPGGTKAWRDSEASLKECHAALTARGYETHEIWGNSMDPAIIAQVRALGPFDCAFIDGDHRRPGVTTDIANYGPMARILSFHDIAWHRAPEWEGTRIDVPEVWAELKAIHKKTEEIVLCPTGKNNGIGVLWQS